MELSRQQEIEEFDACRREVKDLGEAVLYILSSIDSPALEAVTQLYNAQLRNLENSYKPSEWPDPPALIDLHIPEAPHPDGNVIARIFTDGKMHARLSDGFYCFDRASGHLQAVTTPETIEYIKQDLER